MTNEALNKLNSKQMDYCKTLSALIARSITKDMGLRGKLRGYLEAIRDMRVITEIAVRALYLWFSEKERS